MKTNISLQDGLCLTLEAAIAEFLADCQLRQLSPTTLQWYRCALKPLARFASTRGETEISAVTTQTIRAFLGQKSATVQARRLNHYRDAVDRLYQWLIEEQYARTNPAAEIKKIREGKRLMGAFNEAELEALLGEPNTQTFLGLRDYAFMLMLLDTGIRLSEALGLRVHDIDIDGCTLKVLGKGNKERYVGFSPVLERHLRRYLVRRAVALQGIGQIESAWVFPNQQGGQGGAKGFQMRLKTYGDDAGVTRVRVSPHTFRHTFAVWFVRKGGSPFHLQKILGHTSLDMSRRYCDLADTDFISKHQELSPLATSELGGQGRRRLR